MEATSRASAAATPSASKSSFSPIGEPQQTLAVVEKNAAG
jgi:hypothetical protein